MDEPRQKDRRRRARAKLDALVRLRPSEPTSDHFDEIIGTQNVSRDGIYFVTTNRLYKEGMRLFVTFPYSDKTGAINRDYIGEVRRIEQLDNGSRGVAIHLIDRLILESTH